MNLFKLSASYLRFHRLSTFLNVLVMALGIATIIFLLLTGSQIRDNFTRNAAGIDLVVGAKGSPLQLILSSLYHIDAPTGNIPISEAEAVMKDRSVAQAIPMALGDAYRGFRVVGTTTDYPAHFGAEPEEGRLWDGPLEATLGAVAARQSGLVVGSTFHSAHGLGAGGADHGEHPIEVVGVLTETGTVVDRLVLTSIETVWEVHGVHGEDHDEDTHAENSDDHDEGEIDDHEHADEDDHGHDSEDDHGHDEEDDKKDSITRTSNSPSSINSGRPGAPQQPKQEYTAVLIRYASPLAALAFPRYINTETNLQAAAPAYETARLFDLLGVGFDTIRVFGFILVLIALLSVFIALLNAMRERRYDLAMMRSLGASRRKLVMHVVLEGVMLVGMGVVSGLLLGHLSATIIGNAVEQSQGMALGGGRFIPEELLVVALALIAGVAAALIPAIQVYRTDISKVLAES